MCIKLPAADSTEDSCSYGTRQGKYRPLPIEVWILIAEFSSTQALEMLACTSIGLHEVYKRTVRPATLLHSLQHAMRYAAVRFGSPRAWDTFFLGNEQLPAEEEIRDILEICAKYRYEPDITEVVGWLLGEELITCADDLVALACNHGNFEVALALVRPGCWMGEETLILSVQS